MNPYQPTTATVTDAMDADVESSGRGAAGPSTVNLGHDQGQAFENAWSMLLMARQFIDQGKPSLALQLVMAAMRSRGGEGAVSQTLQRARDLYRSKIQENAAADELASLFAECAIAEAQPGNPNQLQGPPPQPPDGGVPPLPDDASDTSILAMSGRKQIMLDAFSDGSSFICLKCGGLVSNVRKDEHLAYWCGKY